MGIDKGENTVVKIHKTVTIDRVLQAVEADDCRGFCTACGAEAFCVEPDASKYMCETCGEREVYGAEELLMMMGGDL